MKFQKVKFKLVNVIDVSDPHLMQIEEGKQGLYNEDPSQKALKAYSEAKAQGKDDTAAQKAASEAAKAAGAPDPIKVAQDSKTAYDTGVANGTIPAPSGVTAGGGAGGGMYTTKGGVSIPVPTKAQIDWAMQPVYSPLEVHLSDDQKKKIASGELSGDNLKQAFTDAATKLGWSDAQIQAEANRVQSEATQKKNILDYAQTINKTDTDFQSAVQTAQKGLEGQIRVAQATENAAKTALKGTITQTEGGIAQAAVTATLQLEAGLYQSVGGLFDKAASKDIESHKKFQESLTDNKVARKADLYVQGAMLNGLSDLGLMPTVDFRLTQTGKDQVGAVAKNNTVIQVPTRIEDLKIQKTVYQRDGKGTDSEEFVAYYIPSKVKDVAKANSASIQQFTDIQRSGKEAKVGSASTTGSATTAPSTTTPPAAGAGSPPANQNSNGVAGYDGDKPVFTSYTNASGVVVRNAKEPLLEKNKGTFSITGGILVNVEETGDNAPIKVKHDAKTDTYFYINKDGEKQTVNKADLYIKPEFMSVGLQLKNGDNLKNAYVPFTKDTEEAFFKANTSKVNTSYDNNLAAGMKPLAAIAMAELDGEEGGGFIAKMFKKIKLWSRLKSEGQVEGNFFGFIMNLLGLDKMFGGKGGSAHQTPQQQAQTDAANALNTVQNIIAKSYKEADNSINISQASAQEILKLAQKNNISVSELVEQSLKPMLAKTPDDQAKAAIKNVQDAVKGLIANSATPLITLTDNTLSGILKVKADEAKKAESLQSLNPLLAKAGLSPQEFEKHPEVLNNYILSSLKSSDCGYAITPEMAKDIETLKKHYNTISGNNKTTEQFLNDYVLSRNSAAGATLSADNVKLLATAVDASVKNNETIVIADKSNTGFDTEISNIKTKIVDNVAAKIKNIIDGDMLLGKDDQCVSDKFVKSTGGKTAVITPEERAEINLGRVSVAATTVSEMVGKIANSFGDKTLAAEGKVLTEALTQAIGLAPADTSLTFAKFEKYKVVPGK